MWRHYFTHETSAELLAEIMLAHQAQFDWDYMKINPRWSYHPEPWGVRTKYDGDTEPVKIDYPVRSPSDWSKIGVIGLDHPVFKEQLKAIELIGKGLTGSVPYMATVFSPVAIASRLVSTDEELTRQLREDNDAVQPALEAITETFAAFAEAAMDRGVDGIFYATAGYATAEMMTAEEYRWLVRPSDLAFFNAIPEGRLHMLHVCRNNNLLAEVADYPVNAFNWDAMGAGNLTLLEGIELLGGKTVVGGVPHEAGMLDGEPHEIAAGVRGVVDAMGATGRWMLGGGCTYQPVTPLANIQAARDAVR
jgi:uroporphyrinogen decarboxylase